MPNETWEIDYVSGIALHPELHVKIVNRTIRQNIGGRKRAFCFLAEEKPESRVASIEEPVVSKHIEYCADIIWIANRLVQKTKSDNGSEVARMIKELGNVFSHEEFIKLHKKEK